MKKLCDLSNKKFDHIIDFGTMPIANNYSKKSKFKSDYNCLIGVSFKNKYYKNINSPHQSKLFTKDYPYNASLSSAFSKYLKQLASEISKSHNIKKHNKFTIEIGSCDGTFLEYFAKNKLNHLGIEPTLNNHKAAKNKNINSINKFFSFKLSQKIKKNYPRADIIFSSNVIAHINNINDTFRGLKNILSKEGVLIFENIYIIDLIKNLSFDQLYDEHVYTLSVTAVNNIAKKHKLNLYDVKHTSIQGGSMRYYLSADRSRTKSSKVTKYLNQEIQSKYFTKKHSYAFFNRCKKIRDELIKITNKIKKDNKKIVGYGASAKATFLVNFCNINASHLDFIFDSSAQKIEKFLPGTNIKIVDENQFEKYSFDFVILFAWNHASEIMLKNKKVMKKNKSKWIIPFPEIKMIK